jgi:hypothetical protein
LSLLDSLQYYDFCFLVRPETQLELLSLGAERALRVFMSYDEVFHSRRSYGGPEEPQPCHSSAP